MLESRLQQQKKLVFLLTTETFRSTFSIIISQFHVKRFSLPWHDERQTCPWWLQKDSGRYFFQPVVFIYCLAKYVQLCRWDRTTLENMPFLRFDVEFFLQKSWICNVQFYEDGHLYQSKYFIKRIHIFKRSFQCCWLSPILELAGVPTQIHGPIFQFKNLRASGCVSLRFDEWGISTFSN